MIGVRSGGQVLAGGGGAAVSAWGSGGDAPYNGRGIRAAVPREALSDPGQRS
jgi:hypothetical protein